MFVFTLGITLALPHLFSAFAADPESIISYQGRLLNTNGVPVSAATASVEFRFFTAVSGGTCVWSNSSSDCDTDTPASTVARIATLTDGLFSENLGDTTLGSPYAAIPDSVFGDNPTLFLEVEVNGETLTPRKRITATGYAINAGMIGGQTADDFLLSTGDTATGDYEFTSDFFSISPDGTALPFAFEPTFFLGSNTETTTNPLALLYNANPDSNQPILFAFTEGSDAVAAFFGNASDTQPAVHIGNSSTAGTALALSPGLNDGVGLSIIDSSGYGSGASIRVINANGGFDEGNVALDIYYQDMEENTGDIIRVVTQFGGLGDNSIFRVDGYGEVFSETGFTAGNTTNYYDGSITDSDANADGFFDFNLSDASDSFRITSGNLRVGSGGVPDFLAMDGEDVYIEGDVEVDGSFFVNNCVIAEQIGEGYFFCDSIIAQEINVNGDSFSVVPVELREDYEDDGINDQGYLGFDLFAAWDAGAFDQDFAATIIATPLVTPALVGHAVVLSQTSDLVGSPFFLSSDLATSGSALASITASAGTYDQYLLRLVNAGIQPSLYIDANGNTGAIIGDAEGGALHISNSGNENTGLSVFSNMDGNAESALVSLQAVQVGFDQSVLEIRNDGIGDAITVMDSTDAVFRVDQFGSVTSGAGGYFSQDYLTVIPEALYSDYYDDGIDDGGYTAFDLLAAWDAGTFDDDFQATIIATPLVTPALAGHAVSLTQSSDLVGSPFSLSSSLATSGSALASITASAGTYDQYLLHLENAGTEPSLYIDANGDTGTTIDDTSGGALHISNSQNVGAGLTVHTSIGATATTPLSQLQATNAAFDVPVLIAASSGTGGVVQIDQAGSGVGLDIRNFGSGYGLQVSAIGATGGSALVDFIASNALFGERLFQLTNNGTGDTLYIQGSNTGNGIFIDQGTGGASAINITARSGGTVFNDNLGGVVHISNTQNDGTAFSIYSNNGADSAFPLAYLHNDNNAFDQAVLSLRRDSDSAAGGASALYIDNNFTDGGGDGAAIEINMNGGNYLFTGNNDTGIDGPHGINLQACLDANPTAACDYIIFRDGDGTVLGAVEGDGAGGVTNASTGSDYAELFPGTYANFEAGDVLGLDASGNVQLAQTDSDIIGTFSIAPNTLGNWKPDWQNLGTWVPVALLGQVPVNVNTSGGSIEVGDYLTLSSTSGVATKSTGPGYVIGQALESHASGSGQIQVYVNPKWHAGSTIASINGENVFSEDFLFGSNGTATAMDQGTTSNTLSFQGSAWNGANAENVKMTLMADVSTTSEYQLAFTNTTGDKVATISESGDFAIAGKLYPSDRGTLQTEKYIYYDSTGSPTLDYMRTNAAGWGVGAYDFAEMFPAKEAVVAGEVVIFSNKKEEVQRSTATPYDNRIAGIISTRPGFLAGEFKEGHVPVALAGRVPTFVTNENGAIKVGDPITTSSRAGYGMKATEAGAIVGYAMEDFNGSEGSIIVFVNVSYYDGGPVEESPIADNVITGTGNLSALNLSGNINMGGFGILSVGTLEGASNRWRIAEDGTFSTRGRLVSIIRSHQGQDVETYATTSTETTVQLSGTAELIDGFASVQFDSVDPNFNDIISNTADFRVYLTANTATGSLYAFDRTTDGFKIRESGNLASDGLVDWMVIAYHKDYEPAESEEDEEEPVEEAPVEEGEDEVIDENEEGQPIDSNEESEDENTEDSNEVEGIEEPIVEDVSPENEEESEPVSDEDAPVEELEEVQNEGGQETPSEE